MEDISELEEGPPSITLKEEGPDQFQSSKTMVVYLCLNQRIFYGILSNSSYYEVPSYRISHKLRRRTSEDLYFTKR